MSAREKRMCFLRSLASSPHPTPNAAEREQLWLRNRTAVLFLLLQLLLLHGRNLEPDVCKVSYVTEHLNRRGREFSQLNARYVLWPQGHQEQRVRLVRSAHAAAACDFAQQRARRLHGYVFGRDAGRGERFGALSGARCGRRDKRERIAW